MLDCTIDVTDKDMPIELAECIYEHKKYFYIDQFPVYNKLLIHVTEMLDKDLLTDSQGTTLSRESQSVKDWLQTPEIRQTQKDNTLFEHMYDEICDLESYVDNTDEKNWRIWHNEPTKRTFYK